MSDTSTANDDGASASGASASSPPRSPSPSPPAPPPPSLPARYRVTPAGTMLAEDHTVQAASIYQQCLLLMYQVGEDTTTRNPPPHPEAGPRLRRLLSARVVQLLSPDLQRDSPELVGSGPPTDDLESGRRRTLRAYLRVLRMLDAGRAASDARFDSWDFGVALGNGYICTPGNHAADAAMAAALGASRLTEAAAPDRAHLQLAELERRAAFAWESESARREAAEAAAVCDECSVREAVLGIRASFGVDDPQAQPDKRCTHHADTDQ